MKLLKTSIELIPEQTDVFISTLQKSNNVFATLSVTPINCSLSDYIRVNLLIDTQITLLGADKDGQIITLGLYQADTIMHTVTYNSNIKIGTDISSFPILSAIEKLDRLTFTYDFATDSYFLIEYKRGY